MPTDPNIQLVLFEEPDWNEGWLNRHDVAKVESVYLYDANFTVGVAGVTPAYEMRRVVTRYIRRTPDSVPPSAKEQMAKDTRDSEFEFLTLDGREPVLYMSCHEVDRIDPHCAEGRRYSHGSGGYIPATETSVNLMAEHKKMIEGYLQHFQNCNCL